jgi:16S rRNA (guanine527-N7)-methyltransferase
MSAEERSPGDAAANRWELSSRQHAQLAALLALLARDEHAPTAVREPAAAATVHVADSLVALELEVIRRARSIADIGAGAGFPGLAIAVALSDAQVSLIESQRRKCEFLQRAIAEAEITNARVICMRAEDWREGLCESDAVLARALAPQPVVLEYAAPLLRLGGTLVDWRGRRAGEQERSADAAAAQLGLRREEVRNVRPFEGATDRYLHLFLKVSATPERFPRRAGVARKRPLAA